MFLYALNYLTGYDAWTMDELKGYGSAKENGFTTLAHGHPEIECPGVEVTTGPLGQGIANSVGLAIASKNLAARFNRPGYGVVNSRIYCMTGDGCLMEGVALEGTSEVLKMNECELREPFSDCAGRSSATGQPGLDLRQQWCHL
jgi:dihydroxyacetone synthase